MFTRNLEKPVRDALHLELTTEAIDGDPAELAHKYERIIFDGLKAVNREYADASKQRARGVAPTVHIHGAGSGPFVDEHDRIKLRYTTYRGGSASRVRTRRSQRLRVP